MGLFPHPSFNNYLHLHSWSCASASPTNNQSFIIAGSHPPLHNQYWSFSTTAGSFCIVQLINIYGHRCVYARACT